MTETVKQGLKFGVIGCSAAATHLLAVIAMVSLIAMPPLVANVFAFCIAFSVSYFGHKYWTFMSNSNHSDTFWKFLLVAVGSFMLNETLYATFLTVWHIQYALALVMVLLIVPPITFVLSKFWAFR